MTENDHKSTNKTKLKLQNIWSVWRINLNHYRRYTKMLHLRKVILAVICSEGLRVNYRGSVAYKSPSCHNYQQTRKCVIAPPRDKAGAQSLSMGKQGKHGHPEIFTYSQTDFLALSGRERWCQIHSFLCRRGERHAMTMGPKQDKEEMFKFRPPLPPSPLSGRWSTGAV